MKTRSLFVLFLLIALKSWGAGLIGRTYEECVAQLGAPAKHIETGAKVVTDLYTFQQGDWSIEIGFWKGVVHLATYKRADGKPLTPAETTALLTGFSDSFAWKKDASGSYRRSDDLVESEANVQWTHIFEHRISAQLISGGPGEEWDAGEE